MTDTAAFLRPATLDEACELKAAHPDATPIAGGTDLMVGLNFGHTRPAALLDLTAVPELRAWRRTDDAVELGAGVPYARVVAELGDDLPGLARASRTVGSPQIRRRGTVGGNIGTSSPAGDALPSLLADRAVIEVRSVRGVRQVPAGEFFLGPGRNVLADDEIVVSVRLPRARGPQQFAKVGTRNAMVIAVASVAVSLDLTANAVACAVGSAAPTVVVPEPAETYAADHLDWSGRTPLHPEVAARFGELVAEGTSPIDDVRASADYRRHAVSVVARRLLGWAWAEAVRPRGTEGTR
ncbi:MAG: xanthine dehydrogenase family protein subunit M [Streptosporangiales bacterium]|nr:xanthine dehydrogenase family protein subunit M [Streptosporangiales bacterium]